MDITHVAISADNDPMVLGERIIIPPSTTGTIVAIGDNNMVTVKPDEDKPVVISGYSVRLELWMAELG